ncbi:MAG: TIGR03435 family protein [Acidobacteriaceae bacterium]|nr:TIGR03435 family protein [Acidobacteriaceae bacterium]
MIPANWISPLANHLWQSTLFAGVAGLLTLALRNNQARTRYCVWLIASLKFLIPLSLLVAIGARLTWSTAVPISQPRVSAVMEQITDPFPQAHYAGTAVPLAHTASLLPALLFIVWICGFLSVAFSWTRRWWRIRALARKSSPLTLAANVPVLASPALLEPGVFGIFRPKLLIPQGIADRLTPAQFEAIVAHEMSHIRRRDNLTAAVHMVVEAIFWFHPLVWWIGRQLIEERERACDEEVLRLGNEPQVYAESILRTCEFYLESSLACVSGVTGADLKKRIICIMTKRISRKLDSGRKLLLGTVGAVALVVPVALGLMNAPQSRAQSPASSADLPKFEVASIKPNKTGGRGMRLNIAPGGRFIAENVSLKLLMEHAYGIRDFQISGAPGWFDSEHYDIEAKPEDSAKPANEDPMKMTEEQRQQHEERLKQMVQSLLADRCKLAFHRETKELPIYALTVAKGGPKLQEVKNEDIVQPGPPPNGPRPGGPDTPYKGRMMRMGRGQINGQQVPLQFLADTLSRQLGRTVVDETGLKGIYNFNLQWTPDESQAQMFKGAPDGKEPANGAPPPESSGPSVFTAIQEQLGLKLESQKGPVEILVIDHVERPSEN